jgi:hypothetical protein
VLLEPVVRAALLRDLGRAGGLTTDAIAPDGRHAEAALVARQADVFAGLGAAILAFRMVEPMVEVAVGRPNGGASGGLQQGRQGRWPRYPPYDPKGQSGSNRSPQLGRAEDLGSGQARRGALIPGERNSFAARERASHPAGAARGEAYGWLTTTAPAPGG